MLVRPCAVFKVLQACHKTGVRQCTWGDEANLPGCHHVPPPHATTASCPLECHKPAPCEQLHAILTGTIGGAQHTLQQREATHREGSRAATRCLVPPTSRWVQCPFQWCEAAPRECAAGSGTRLLQLSEEPSAAFRKWLRWHNDINCNYFWGGGTADWGFATG